MNSRSLFFGIAIGLALAAIIMGFFGLIGFPFPNFFHTEKEQVVEQYEKTFSSLFLDGRAVDKVVYAKEPGELNPDVVFILATGDSITYSNSFIRVCFTTKISKFPWSEEFLTMSPKAQYIVIKNDNTEVKVIGEDVSKLAECFIGLSRAGMSDTKTVMDDHSIEHSFEFTGRWNANRIFL